MPGGVWPAAFSRKERRFVVKGINLNAPPDAMPPGKVPFLLNARSYIDGTLQARQGLTVLTNGNFGVAIHSIARLNDSTAFAAAAFWRVFGTGNAVRAGNSSFPQIDTGYSGNPLMFVNMTPVQAPQPFLYIADSSRTRKIDVNSHVYTHGIAPPTIPTSAPSVVLQPLFVSFLQDFGVAPLWIAAGAANAPNQFLRINTTISQIKYDQGTTGNCSIAPASMANINVDTMVTVGGVETLPVQQVCIAVASTTIAAIIYDSGTSGLCTIQPSASLGTGVLDAPDPKAYQIRAGDYAVPRGQATEVPSITQSAITPRTRQIDFPVNCLVTLNGTETVRILSVAVGPDGIQSFRCSTTGTFAAGNTIVGVPSFRMSTANNYTAGATLQSSALHNTITPAGPAQTIGGIQSPPGWTIVNKFDTINGRATLPDDDIHLSIRFSDTTVVEAVRLYLDVDPTTNDFTRNYYFFEWRANDIIDAIQNANAAAVDTLQSVRTTVVGNAIINQDVGIQRDPDRVLNRSQTGLPGASDAVSSALSAGNSQWLELKGKVRNLQRVGTDPSRTLGNIAAAEVLVMMTGTNPITVDYSSCWLSGGYGPDVGALGQPYVYAYRYRSSITGARSMPSPPSAGGVMPARQQVIPTGVQSPLAEIDLVDWFRIGGNLTAMTYAGTGPNSATPTFNDNFSDQQLDGGPELEYDIFQPWPILDKQRTGTCNVAGNAIRQTAGDTFNLNWAPGTIIVVNGQQYTLRGSPSSTTLLFTNENIGSGTGLTWTIPAPTIMGQPLPSFWGPDVNGICYAAGDTSNPGTLYWTYPNDPDRTSDAYQVQVTSGSERLLTGFVYDDQPYVFSSDQLYRIVDDGNGGRATVATECGRGPWTPWFMVVTPRGTYFGTKDGIYFTSAGSASVSITDADLYPLFPHDGVSGQTVNGVVPPDYTQPNRLRLAYVDGLLYFDFQDTGGNDRTLVFRESDGSWWHDVYVANGGNNGGAQCRLSQTGARVFEELVGGSSNAGGNVFQIGTVQDNGAAYQASVTLIEDMGDARRQKLIRDVMLDADLTAAQCSVALGLNNVQNSIGTTVVGNTAGRAQYQVNVQPTTGLYGTNLRLDLTWTPVVAAPAVPLLYVLDIAFQPGMEIASSWLSGPTTFGQKGYLHIPQVWIAYISTTTITVSVIIDGVLNTYTLPSSGGIYAKNQIWLKALKGLAFQLGFQATAPFQLFPADCEVFVQSWGVPGGYSIQRPF